VGLASAVAAGCGPDLARLETEQQALEQEVAVLRRRVEEMRTQVKAMGAAPSGPGADVPATGSDDLAGRLTFTATRTGPGPAMPALGAPERRESTACGWRFPVPWLEALSDVSLESSGSGRASPVRLLHDGAPLDPHAGPIAYERTCRGAFRHLPKYLFFSPSEVEQTGGAWTLALAPEVPAPTGDRTPAYWVYPDTTLVFAFAAGWDEAWGPMGVRLDARVLHVGTPASPSPRGDVAATAAVLGFERSTAEPRLGFDHTPPAPTGPWTLTIASPNDGPYVLVDALVVGNPEHSLVVVHPFGAGGGDGAGPGNP
jgi:hypothetical protein